MEKQSLIIVMLRGFGWAGFLWLAGCSRQPSHSSDMIPVLEYKVIRQYPHNPDFWTQGLVFDNGFLYEGTGQYGHSAIHKIATSTGQILQSRHLDAEYFGEGITILGNRLIQLTWTSHVGFVYDKDSFSLLEEFEYDTEGWGLTHDGKDLILSDGTDRLYWLDAKTFSLLRELSVTAGGIPIGDLNELEYVDGAILANVWNTDRIARIDPQSGKVTAWIDLTGIFSPQSSARPVDVLNGIAHNPSTGRLYVTGKLWPVLFEIEIITKPPPSRP